MKTALFYLLAALPLSAVTVSTAQNDNTRAGVNAQETILTPANVSGIGAVGTYSLDGPIFSQVLYVPGVTVSAKTYNVLVAATMSNTVYCFNADAPGSAALWSTNFGTPWSTYPEPDGQPNFYAGSIGILSTPVVDVANGYVYVVSVNNTPVYTLRKIALSTGVQSLSVSITGSVSGTGSGSSGGTLAFNPDLHNQRLALTLANSNVYVGFSLLSNNTPWHGWLMSYDTATLTQQAIFCTSPNGIGAGLWESGGGAAVDGSGNLYIVTGAAGSWNGTTDFAQSIVKLSPSLVVLDYFTPANWNTTQAQDADMSSGRGMLLNGTSQFTLASKDGRVWLISTATGQMGELQGGSGTAPQVFQTPPSFTPASFTGCYGGLFFNSTGLFPIAGNPSYAYSYSGGQYNTTAIASTVSSYGQVMMSGSSNSGSNPILWMLTVNSSPWDVQQAVTLHATNPATLVDYASWTSFGHYAKFAAPTIANGCVYVPTNDGTVVAFGLPVPTSLSGSATLSGSVSIQ